MRYFPTRKEDDIRDLGKLVAKAVADALANINTGAGNIVVIRKINVSINYASGGGATVNVLQPTLFNRTGSQP